MKILFVIGLMVVQFLNADTCSDLSFDRNGIPKKGVSSATVTIIDSHTTLFDENNHSIGTVGFNSKYYIARIRHDTYFSIQEKVDEQPIGYVKINDVFCGGKPVKATSGLDQKFYVKTETVEQGTDSYVNAYYSATATTCGENRQYCSKLKRYKSYYIYKKSHGRYLIAAPSTWKRDTLFKGWVNEEDGFIWNTAIGLRPSEKLGKTEIVEFYTSIQDIRKHHKAGMMKGGMYWYDLPMRLAVLDKIDVDGEDYYELAAPITGVGVERGKDGALYYTTSGINAEIDNMRSQHKFVDILFLIDGTASMQPYLDQIVGNGGLVDKFSQKLSNIKYDGLVFRTTYRIYRDKFDKRDLREGFSLNRSCQEPSSPIKRVSNIGASLNDSDDYPENLYGGINQALEDISTCPDNRKIIIIIGDAGDREDGKSISLNALVRKLKRKDDESHHKVLIFVRTPLNTQKRQNEKYMKAYNSFLIQAGKFKRALNYRDADNDMVEVVSSLTISDVDETVDQILHTSIVRGYLNYQAVKIVIGKLEDGENLDEALHALKVKGILALLTEEIRDGSCEGLGEACKGKVYDTVKKIYIKVDKKSEEDIFFQSGNFDNFKILFDRIKWNPSMNKADARKKLVKILKENIVRMTGQSIVGEFSDRRLDKYLQEYGLPTRVNSPLLRYSINQLKKVDYCVIKQLYRWIEGTRKVLRYVARNEKPKVKVVNDDTQVTSCPVTLPYHKYPILHRHFSKLKPPRVGYVHENMDDNIEYYWVPKKFLP